MSCDRSILRWSSWECSEPWSSLALAYRYCISPRLKEEVFRRKPCFLQERGMERDNICYRKDSYGEEYVGKLKECLSNHCMQCRWDSMTYASATYRRENPQCCGSMSWTLLGRQWSIWNLCIPISSRYTLRPNVYPLRCKTNRTCSYHWI